MPDHDYVAEMPTRRYLSGIFSIPLGINGWKFEAGGVDGVTTPHGDPSAATKGVYNEGYLKLAYEALKRRDYELTVNARLDAENQKIETLIVDPAVLLSSDRLRVLRTGVDGIWRVHQTGTTIIYGGNYSHGLDAHGARTAAESPPWMPLSRQGADAVFDKIDGHLEIDQALPYDFFVNFLRLRTGLLRSSSADARAVRHRRLQNAVRLHRWLAARRHGLGRPRRIRAQFHGAVAVWRPCLRQPANASWKIRPCWKSVMFAPPITAAASASTYFPRQQTCRPYGFVEGSHRTTNLTGFSGDRIFAGLLLQY